MSENEIYFPKLSSLRDENLTLYHELRAYIENLPGGPWHYIEGFDGSHRGEIYHFNLSCLYRPTERISILAEKRGPHFSFSCKRIDVR